MRSSTPAGALLIILAFLSSTPAVAAMRRGVWEIEGEVMRTAFGGDADVKNAFGAGARFGYVVTPEHEVEIGLERIGTEDDLSPDSKVEVRILTLGYVQNLRAETDLVPFFTLGLGLERMEAADLPAGSRVPEQQTSLVVLAGGGVRAFFGKRFNVRADGVARAVDSEPDLRLDLRVGLGVGWLLGE